MKRNSKNGIDRREFLQTSSEVAAAIGALSAGITIMPRLASAATKCNLDGSAAGSNAHRKYLISMECSGGIDNAYMAAPLDPSQFSGMADRYSRFSQDAGRSISHIAHPSAPGHYIGPALLPSDYNDFRANDLLGDFLFVKGLAKEGEHGLGNRIVANGGTSVYNAGFCSLIADYCARIKEKPFQHVALGAIGYNQTGMLSGGAVPTLIGDMAAFQSSVQDLSNDANALKRKSFVKQTVKELYSSIAEQTLAKCESQKMYLDFGKFFEQVMGIREKPILYSEKTVNWDEIWNWWNGFLNHQYGNHPMSHMKMNDQRAKYFGFGAPAAFYGAFIEFLIRRDLTSVVNFGYQSGDRHSSNKNSPGGFLAEGQIQASFGCIFTGLMHRLKKVSLNEGGTLLDRTLMVVTSEFDRTPHNDGGGGSDHGGYHTLLMAGSGNRGVLGGIVSKSGQWAGYRGVSGEAVPYDCLTVNKDGTPNKDGKGILLNSSSALPLVIRLMGASLPPQQITQASQAVDQMTWMKKIPDTLSTIKGAVASDVKKNTSGRTAATDNVADSLTQDPLKKAA